MYLRTKSDKFGQIEYVLFEAEAMFGLRSAPKGLLFAASVEGRSAYAPISPLFFPFHKDIYSTGTPSFSRGWLLQ